MNYKNLLQNKKILIGVTGSIAIYKSLELIRLFVKNGAIVRVVMSDKASEFITPLTFEAISQHEVLTASSQNWRSENNHIGFAKWADIFIIAPATANTINKLSHGIADNILLECALACTKPIVVAPSANSAMYENIFTKNSLKLLNINGFNIVEPTVKTLACGDVGVGALAEVSDIFFEAIKILNIDSYWENRRVVVSGGGSVERVDDVRFISNFSSGKMAFSIAKALHFKGADVCLVSSKEPLDLPKGIHVIKVESGDEFKTYIEEALNVAKKGVLIKPNLKNGLNQTTLIQKKPYLFMTAAISDYKPKFRQSGKLKKEFLGESFALELELNSDILATINKEDIFSVGFKAEFDEQNGFKSASKKLEKLNLDAICLNFISKNGFGGDENEIELILKDRVIKLEKDDKLNIAIKMLDCFKEVHDR